jgi:quercetin dioxygenase-like cupin family protein
MEFCTNIDSIPWAPHPVAEGVEIKPLVTKKDHGLDVTCVLVKVPAGIEVPEHIHEAQADILYPLQGRAEMFVEGAGSLALKPGVVVRVPAGVKHRIFNVAEELVLYDVFQPATV